ncbi:MAG: right-handed parallel beta-helix repeat-containing protein [Candidatus Dormibacteria bacterium]
MLLVILLGSNKPATKENTGGRLGLATDQSGTAYYVDSQGGNDSNAGTSPGAAWKTLEKVDATVFHPGERILLRSGSVWSGQLWPKGSGAQGLPITLNMYGGGVKPVINGDGLVEDAVLLKNQEYWNISNLEVTNHGTGSATRRGVHVAVENYGDAHHIYIRSLTVHDVNGNDDVKVNGGIHFTVVGEKKPSRFVDLRIENNDVYHVDRDGITGWSDEWQRSKWHPSIGVIIRGNILDDIGGDGIVAVATDGAVIEHNIVGHANQRSAGYDVAIWSWSADNTVMQFNEAYGTKGQRDGEGFDSDWNSRNTLIQYNYSHDNDGGFLLICNEGAQGPRDSAGNTGTIVRYNISRDDRTRGIAIAGPVKNSSIYNNTFYVGPQHDVSLLLQAGWQGWADGTSLFNNIFFVDGSAQFAYGITRGPDGAYRTTPGFGSSTHNVFNSNVYFGRVAPPDDANASTADPRFAGSGTVGIMSPSPADYQLRRDSPDRRNGKVIRNNGGRDFWGAPVPSCGGIARGAFQPMECKAAGRGKR